MVVSDDSGSITSSVAALFLKPFINDPFPGGAYAIGSNTVFTVGAVGSGNLAYQWYRNGQAIPNATNKTLIFNSIQATNNGLYSAIVTSTYGSATNALASVTVMPPITITAQPASATNNIGDTVHFFVGVTNVYLITYQWSKDGIALTGATNSFLTVGNVQPVNIGNYTVTIIDIYGNTVTSSIASLSLNGENSRLWQGLIAYYPFNGNADDASVNGNDGTPFNISYVPSRFGGTNLAASFSTYSYITTPVLSGAKPLNGSISVWVMPGGNQAAPNSGVSVWNASQLGNDFSFALSNSIPSIWVQNNFGGGTAQPLNINQKSIIPFNYSQIVLTWSTNGTSLFLNGSQIGTETNNLITGSTDPLGFGNFFNMGDYSSYFGGSISDARIYNRALSSNDVAALFALEAFPGPNIVTNPANYYATAHTAASFSVTATSTSRTPLAYQWQFNGGKLINATNSTLVITNVLQSNIGQYAVVVTNLYGSVTSSAAALYMYPYLNQPFTGLTTFWGQSNTLSVGAWGSGSLGYQWFFNGQVISGARNATLTFSGIQFSNAGLYSVVVSNNLGSITNPSCSVVVNPANATVIITNLSQIYTGNALPVEVLTSPAGLVVNVTYNGSTNAPTNSGSYQVVATVTNPEYQGGATNTLLIYYPVFPTILKQPTNQTVERGALVNLSVSAVSSTPLRYQWRKNLGNITSATNSTLTLINVQTNATDGYRVVVANSSGSVTSDVAQLTVVLLKAPLTLNKTGLGTLKGATNNQILIIGNLYKLSAKAAKGFAFKNWTDEQDNVLANTASLSFLMRSNLSLTANFIETSLPKLTITSPVKNAKLNGSSVGMTGTASDAWAVTNVSYAVNSGAWNRASTGNNYSNWTATVTLAAGTNTIRVYAQNQGGLSSLTNSLKVIATNVLTLNLVINSQNQAPMQARSMAVAVPASKGFTFSLELSAGVPGHIEYSTDLVHWTTWTNFDGSSTLLQFNDPQAGESSRFYRAVTP